MSKPVELAWPAAILLALTVLLASMPAWLHLPLPPGGLVFDRAVLVFFWGRMVRKQQRVTHPLPRRRA